MSGMLGGKGMRIVSPFLTDQDLKVDQVLLYPEVVCVQLSGCPFARAGGENIVENLGKGLFSKARNLFVDTLNHLLLFLFLQAASQAIPQTQLPFVRQQEA